MVNSYDIKTIFSFFFKSGFRAKRTKLFFLFSLIPPLIFIIINVVYLLNPEKHFQTSKLFVSVGASFYFQLFIPLISLFYGSSVINDEIDNKTLIYLTTSSVSKASVLMGKFLTNFLISAITVISGIFISYVILFNVNVLRFVHLKDLSIFAGVALLAILTYSMLFTLFGTLLKKSVLVGVFFIFGWESVVQFFPGATQKLTINHYIKSLLPANISSSRSILSFQLQPSSTFESIITLLLMALLFLILSIFIFYKKEFTLSD